MPSTRETPTSSCKNLIETSLDSSSPKLASTNDSSEHTLCTKLLLLSKAATNSKGEVMGLEVILPHVKLYTFNISSKPSKG